MNQNTRIKISLYLNYFVFAILLNSVGIVILKSQNLYGVDEVQASILEAFKDFPIAVVSFLIASLLPRIGYKKGMLIGLAVVTFACLGMYFGNNFSSAKILFLAVGASFALIKVSVYASIGLVTNSKSEHNSLMSSIEGFFMFGITFAYFLFPWFNNEADPSSWVNVYLLLAGLSALSFLFLWTSKFDSTKFNEKSNVSEDFIQMFSLIVKLVVVVFLISAFLFVMVEQGIMTWLPTFNQRVLGIDDNLAIMMSSVLFISLGIGRLLAGQLVKKIPWFYILAACLIMAMLMVVFVLPEVINAKVNNIHSFTDVPLIGYAFPLVGLFLAPIYPLINSVILTALPNKLHSQMSGLIIIFSAIGGTLGSRTVGYLFKNMGAESAFTYTLIPLALLLLSLYVLNRLTINNKSIQ